MQSRALTFRPVADDDTATVEYGTGTSLPVVRNDIFYLPALRLAPRTLDLNPDVPGRQLQAEVTGGTFTAGTNGTVTFAPADGFTGRAIVVYTVADTLGRTSNRASVTVTVKPRPLPAQTLFDFENGTQGWGPADFNPTAGTVATTTAFHADGVQGLRLTATDGGWFGAALPTPEDLTTRSVLSFASPSANGSFAVSFQTGPESVWCQGDARPAPDRPGYFELDLTAVAAGCPGLGDVRTVNLYLGGNQQQDIDAMTIN
jgi:mannan endo-1,4-beta-mannosidase